MDAKWQALFFGLAVVFFVLDAFEARDRLGRVAVAWTPLGLACFAVPFLWNAAEAGW